MEQLNWEKILEDEFKKEYFLKITEFISKEIKLWKTIYPPKDFIFNAFNKTSFDKIKIVILWQDPYHWEKQAHWLSLTVQDWVKIPPSLKNIFKELENDLNIKNNNNWNLEKWSKNWVLLLNSILTVEKNKPASHRNIWWEIFTDNIIKIISEKKENIIFILWWNFAKSKINLIDLNKHHIIQWAHPSPFSAYNWFFWTKPFSKCNTILKTIWQKEIDWSL